MTLASPAFPIAETNVPVRIKLVSERMLCVDGEPRRVVWSMGENGTTTYLVEGSSKAVRNRERRASLARTSALLDQLRDRLLALKDGSETPEFIVESLGVLYEWTARERERLTVAPRSMTERQEARQTTAEMRDMNTPRRRRTGP